MDNEERSRGENQKRATFQTPNRLRLPDQVLTFLQNFEIQLLYSYVASYPNPLKVKVNSERAWDIVISH